MVSPSRPWPRPSPFDDKLSEIVARGSVQEARGYFDDSFWQNQKEQPGWEHLRIALLREDRAMIRLLATWGAHPTEKDMAEFRDFAKDKYDHYLLLLRQGGLRSNGKPWEEVRPVTNYAVREGDQIVRSFVNGEFVDHRVGMLPQEWLKALRAFQQNGAEEAIIAGGAIRDTLNEKPVKDVDIFLRSRGSTRKNRKFLKKVFEASGLEVREQEFRYTDAYGDVTVKKKLFPDPKKQTDDQFNEAAIPRERQLESWTVIAGARKEEYNIIFVSDTLDKKLMKEYAGTSDSRSIFAGGLLEAFDIGLCQVATDGREIVSTDAYKEDVKNKRITLTRPNFTTDDHLKRVMAKYEGWGQSASVREYLKPKPPQPPPPRYSWY